ncbi:MAG: membrane lipoprotein lipid attachment site-containing protein [Sulfurimonas sp.]
MKQIIFSILTLFLLSGCSAKEFKEGADGIANDISNAFNSSKDDSN